MFSYRVYCGNASIINNSAYHTLTGHKYLYMSVYLNVFVSCVLRKRIECDRTLSALGRVKQIKPTQSHGHRATRATRILDIVLSSQKELVDNVEIKEPLGSSDHNQMHFNINVKSDKTKVKQCRRDFRKGN